jgi:lantibiotic transport system permease protein
MAEFFRAVAAEAVKIRGTLARRLCWVAPLVVVGLDVLMMLVRKFPERPIPRPTEAWLGFTQEAFGLWAFLMLPLFITLQSALLAQLEHGERQWKHLLALPVGKGVHYGAKVVMLVAMIFTAFLFLGGFTLLGGYFLAWAKPSLGISGPGPFGYLLEKGLQVFLISTAMITIHTWIAIRWTSFTVAVATGMSATVIGFLVGQSEYRAYYPWSMTLQVLGGKAVEPGPAIAIALIVAAAAYAWGLWDFRRREFT